MATVTIKCPFCGAILQASKVPDMEKRSITCSVCNHKNPFTKFKIIKVTPSNNGDGDTQTDFDEYTQTDISINTGIGCLKSGSTTFTLKEGRNVIGRKAEKATADIQIDTGESREMSREHIVITVSYNTAKGYVHKLSLFKEKVNKVCVGTEEIVFGDTIILNDGNEITLPDAKLIFSTKET